MKHRTALLLSLLLLVAAWAAVTWNAPLSAILFLAATLHLVRASRLQGPGRPGVEFVGNFRENAVRS